MGEVGLGGWIDLGLSSEIPARDPDGSRLSVEQYSWQKGLGRCEGSGGQGQSAAEVDRPAHTARRLSPSPQRWGGRKERKKKNQAHLETSRWNPKEQERRRGRGGGGREQGGGGG